MQFQGVLRFLKMKRGLSIIEVLVSTAVMMAIVMSSTDFITFFVKKNRELRAATESKVEMQMVRDYLRVSANQVGGGTVRPWMAVWTENNCLARVPFPNCFGSDRLTLAYKDYNINTCIVTSATVGNNLNFDPITGADCCSNTHLQKPIALNKTGYYAQFYVDAVTSGGGICRAHVVNGQASGINGQAAPPTFTDWGGANLDVMEIETFYFDNNLKELHSFRDLDNDGTIDAGEDNLVGANVYDFQIMLGYDASPSDGIVSDSASQLDEWLFNFAHAQEPLGVGGGGLATATFVNLRALGFGLITGARATGSQSRILDGPLRNDVQMKLVSSVEKIYFQSSLYFQ